MIGAYICATFSDISFSNKRQFLGLVQGHLEKFRHHLTWKKCWLFRWSWSMNHWGGWSVPPPGCRVGVHTGECVGGMVGEPGWLKQNISRTSDNHGPWPRKGFDEVCFPVFFFCFLWDDDWWGWFSTLASNLWQIALHLVAMIGGRGCNMLKGVARWFEKLELIFEEAWDEFLLKQKTRNHKTFKGEDLILSIDIAQNQVKQSRIQPWF